MVKRLFYLSAIFIFYIFFNFTNIEAKEYCHLYLNDELVDTITLPFYFYEIERNVVMRNANLPIMEFNKITTYIDSLTKCELIDKNIVYYSPSKSKKSVIADYSYEETTLSNEELFNQAAYKTTNTRLKGLATKYDEEAPLIKGYEEKYITNINSPLNLSILISYFSAYDNMDGNISDKIKIEYEEYTKNITIIGNYLVILSVEDSASNKATISFYIEIIDNSPPIIEGENHYTSFFSSPLNVQDIKINLSVSDNTDKDLNNQIFICNDTFTSNKNIVGIHYLYFCVYDKSENLSNQFEVSIEVIDDIPPIIEGLNYYESKQSSPLTIKEIMYSIAASDNGIDISDSIFVTSDNYSNNQHTLGEKTIYFQAMDKYNNISSPFKVTINLIDDVAPQIFGLNIFNSYLSSPLSLTHLKQQLMVIDNYDGNVTNNLEIINDSYSYNINKIGTFYITFKAKDSSSNFSEEFKITINSFDDVSPYIIGPNSLTYQIDNKPTIQIIINEFKAYDNIDENLEIKITEENYTDSIETGTFYIEVSSKESSENISPPFMIKIEIVDKIINVKEVSLFLTTSQLLTIKEIGDLIELDSDYKIVSDTYTSNFNIAGNYEIQYQIDDNTIISVNITTITPKNNILLENSKEQKKETFTKKVKRFFKKIFSYIKKIFNKFNLLNIFQHYEQYHSYFENQL